MTQHRTVWLLAVGLALGGVCGCGDSEASDGNGTGGSGGSSGRDAGGSGTGGDGAGGTGGDSAGGTGGDGAGGTGGDSGMDGGSGAGGTGGSSGMDAGPDGEPGPDDGSLPLDVCEPGDTYGDPLPPAAMRTATLVQGGFDFLEGPVWHSTYGALFFSDMDMSNVGANGVASQIHKLVPPDTFSVLVPSSGSNGLAVSSAGPLYACVHDTQTIATISPVNGTRFDVPLTYMGNNFNSPNDMTERSDGHVYFTDPNWQLTANPPRSSETGITGVYHLDLSSTVTLVDGTLDRPNGIALSPDGNTLYVGSVDDDVFRYDLDSNGNASNRQVFASPGASDGFTVDCAGNLYVTSGSKVYVYEPDGDEIGQISVAENPANVAFGGYDRKTLYITARTGLYRIKLNVPGYPY